MLRRIVKREVYDNMMSLRFALTLVLLLILMVVNAVNYQGEYQRRIGAYRQNVSQSLDQMRSQAVNFFNLVKNGPGKLYKKPTPLNFCADGGEASLSGYAEGKRGPGHGLAWTAIIRNEKNQVAREAPSVGPIWQLTFPQSNHNARDVSPHFIKIDWVFLIAYVLSIVAILFTFDAISSERERGTLRLVLANSVPRDIVLLGKFIGALISIGIPFLIAGLINLFLLSTSGGIQLGSGEWGRLGAIFLIALVYVCIFIALGLLISARVRQSGMGLMILLLLWTIVVVLTPSTLGSIAGGLKPPMPHDEYYERGYHLIKDIRDAYNFDEMRRTTPITRDIPLTKATSLMSELFIKEAQAQQRLNQEHLNAQISQIQLARKMTRISPAAIVQYAIESLAGTGLPGHVGFLAAVRRYAAEFQEFLIETDAADPESPHAIGVWIGASQKPVSFDAIPKFEDGVSFSGSFNVAIVDILLLVLFLVVLFALAYLSFLRIDV